MADLSIDPQQYDSRSQSALDDALKTVNETYPAISGLGLKVQPDQGPGFAETYSATEERNPNFGTPTVGVRKSDMSPQQLKQLLLGESLHILPEVDKRFDVMRSQFVASMQPSQMKVAQKMYDQREPDDKRSFSQYVRDVVAPAFIRDYVWKNTGGTPGGEPFVQGVGPISDAFFPQNLPALDGILKALKSKK